MLTQLLYIFKLGLEEWTQISQIITTILMGVGIIYSIWLGIKTLNQVISDRSLKVRPKCIFDHGAQVVPCELLERDGIPGINIEYAKEILKLKPKGAKSCISKGFWGRLNNHGNGSAFNTRIIIITKKIHKANEEFEIDDDKLHQFPYSPNLNKIPASPSAIRQGESAKFLRIPTPVVTDFTGQLSMMQCICLIMYEDLYGKKYETAQELRVFIRRNEEKSKAEVTLTFSNEIIDYKSINL